jgi:formylglycine-generating enzyme required for sulfatase activity
MNQARILLTFISGSLLTTVAFGQNAILGGKSRVENSIKMEMLLVPAGNYMKGAPENSKDAKEFEKPSRMVTISKPFYLQSTEVTNEQFGLFCEATDYVTQMERKPGRVEDNLTWRDPSLEGTKLSPVVYVTIRDAESFCLWLSGKEGKKYRLPTDEEWEYCCRAGSAGEYTAGRSIKDVCYENCLGPSELVEVKDIPFHSRTWECGSGRANNWGFFDMHGNAAELVDAFYERFEKAIRAPSRFEMPIDKFKVVVRGGNFKEGPESAKCYSRGWHSQANGSDGTGFRVVMEIESSLIP